MSSPLGAATTETHGHDRRTNQNVVGYAPHQLLTERVNSVDAGIITAIVGALGVLGAGAKYVIDRMDRKRENREAAVEELLKSQAAKAEARAEQAESDAKALHAADERKYSRLHATATKWREQLIINHIDPLPAEWPEDTHE